MSPGAALKPSSGSATEETHAAEAFLQEDARMTAEGDSPNGNVNGGQSPFAAGKTRSDLTDALAR